MKKMMSQVFILLALSSCSWFPNLKSRKNAMFVGANLLKQLPKPIVEVMLNNNRFITEFSDFRSSRPDESDSAEAAYQEFAKDLDAKLEIYCDFLNDFSKSKKWDSIRVLFPTTMINQYVCVYIQRYLVQSHVHVLCGTYDHEKSLLRGNETVGQGPQMTTAATTATPQLNNSITQNTQTKGFAKLPIVTLNFLHVGKGHEISSALARQFSSKAFVIMLGSNFSLPNLRPKLNFNYRLTLASYVGEQENDNSSNAEVRKGRIYVEDIYGFATSPDSIRKPLGYWSSTDGLHLGEEPRLENFHGQVLRVTSVEGNPVVYLDRDSNTDQVVAARGYLPDILETLSITLNFTYVLIEPKDRGFGSVDAAGNWTGMVGQMKRQEVDIAMMSFSFTKSRKEVMDFSPPIEYSAARLLIRRDVQNTELKWNVFLEPFHWEVWLAIPCTVILGIILVYGLTQFKIMDDVSPMASTCCLFVCLLQKSLEGHQKFEKLPSRIVLGSIWLLAVVIYASYTAVLTSFLASTTEKLPINSLSEAAFNSHWKVGLVKGSSYEDRVKSSPQSEFLQFSKRIESDRLGLVSGFRDGVEKVYKEKYAFFTSDLVPTFMIKDNCSFTWVPGSYFAGFGYMGYQKNLPYANPLSHKVAKIRETGQMRRLFKKWWGENSGCSGIGGEFKGMSLFETGTAFLLLLVGASIALSMLAFELVWQPKKNLKNSSRVFMLERGVSEGRSSDHEFESGRADDSRAKQPFTYNDFGSIFGLSNPRIPDSRSGYWRPYSPAHLVK